MEPSLDGGKVARGGRRGNQRLKCFPASAAGGERRAASGDGTRLRTGAKPGGEVSGWRPRAGQRAWPKEPDWLGPGRMVASPCPLPPRVASPQIVWAELRREQEVAPCFLLLANDGGRAAAPRLGVLREFVPGQWRRSWIRLTDWLEAGRRRRADARHDDQTNIAER